MLKLFSAFRKEKVWDFNGGIHPPEMKTQSNGTPLRQLPLPGRFIIPLKQHIGSEGEICVAPGDKVLRGQQLTVGRGRMLPVHAPTSGTVTAIMPHPTAHPSALPELSIIIDADGEDRWIARDGWSDYQCRSREALIERIHQFGVAGLGGAGFPTGTKLQGGGDKIETLIINAAECEPYITADDRLMQDCAAQIIDGVRILAHILQPREVLIGIEDNKPQAISMMRAVLHGEHKIRLRVIPTKYPSGGAKQLTQILTGKQVPHGGRSSDIGVLMQNVGTAFAVKRAIIDGEPLTERVVTLTGEAVGRPGNVWARIGTPVRHLLEHAGFIPTSEQLVIMGGPLMGFTLPGLDVPVVKITNCLLAPSATEMGAPQEEQHCIRCSACADACPADLLPQQLYWFSVGQQHDKATAHNLADCIECGACAYVCPSNIPLVQYFRQEKAEIRAIAEEEKRAAEAKARFEARQARLEREKAARLERHKKSAVQPSGQDQDAIQAALARVREKKGDDQPIIVAAGAKPDNSAVIAAREARKAEARARQAEKVQQEMAANSSVPAHEATEPEIDASAESVDPRKAAVEAAIARAKARKAAQAGENATADATPAEPVDPRKAAVEAAIARAKARKAAQAGENATADATPAEPVDPRKAAVEAAIARAKARKAAQAGENATADATPAEPVDPRKAAVEAAIARAKARKAAQAGENATADEKPAEPLDPRKAAVEAAIARAKARKAAQAGENATANEKPAEPVDPRKAAVEAAVARAKARKAAQANERAQAANEEDEADDPRKAAVAAAIARVQARKAAEKVVNED
ncbi:electron transport complex subunit RsxC [Cronobacter malonaticus]|uniref:electron transport complex subunit RsxC n=1 Tax=Cronobacter malonaticus TaxID=413503 RepID=UPI000742D47D|nr:electron transport complex subunit RsxC [Cronobacter malonaticus]ALX78803.1 electron transport complex subunit RsxC [Cronobacter malonaticus LMG 23826]EGT4312562.1 electron transport complex subunit RsxC [Cronobacter malonaticus]EGT4398316.1 electron transport complex subunit RsxC [Cronobacter malonaticus]EGT4461440.1 electron transport complex subunit RsxC [Cronobacter malonaticus]EGT4482154.1 electron transport complex subunit RsxC [Cronobacter malonaticus]